VSSLAAGRFLATSGEMRGPEIIVRSMTAQHIPDQFGNEWQYSPWSDSHSKITCWAVMFDLLRRCPLLKRHVADGTIGFGINHTMTDFTSGRPKDLDLVVSIPRSGSDARTITFESLVDDYGIELTPSGNAYVRAKRTKQ